MRLQRVGRKNDPSFRIVVTDKRTGPKSNKNVAILGSYNPKLNQVQVDKDAAKEWLSKGVQPSDTVHNILVGQKVLEAKKVNVLPKKSPIVDEEAIKKAEEEAAAKAEAEKAAAEEATAEDASAEETPSEDAPADAADAKEETAEIPAEDQGTDATDVTAATALTEAKEEAEESTEESTDDTEAKKD
ncbi:30S ribosomal protein S16 [Candidatus Pacebacteria bacterium]|nr:30S ribosomal protein S16 [Candidatus Paceibacterota bacterium]